MRDAQKAANQAPRYDNRHRNLTPEQELAFQAEGREAVIRFRIDEAGKFSNDRCVVHELAMLDSVETW